MMYSVDNVRELTIDEAEYIKKMIDYKERICIIEEKELFFLGFKECYNLVNKIKNIDDKHTE